jgi:AcrR family transcriptional regulator
MRANALTRDQIVGAAIDLLDSEGLDGLNMRALGTRLGSAATAMYWHVGSKERLIALAADHCWNDVGLPDPDLVGWRAAAEMLARELHAMLGRHPWLVQATGSYVLYGDGKARHDDRILAVFETAGFAGAGADQAAATLMAYVLGTALGPAAEVARARRSTLEAGAAKQLRDEVASATEIAMQYPRLRARLEASSEHEAAPVELFEFGLRAILDGLEEIRRTSSR